MAHDESYERLVPGETADEGMLQRHLAGYAFVAAQVAQADRILDCGCGMGYGAQLLTAHCGPTVGFDRELSALLAARQPYPAPHYLCGEALQLPFVTGAFDLIVVSQVLEHFAEPGRLCAELARVARPGARVFIMVPNALTQAPAASVISSYHAQEFGPQALRELLAAYFAECRLWGAFPGPLMARWEGADTWARRSVARDRLGLRRLVPAGVRAKLLGLLRGRRAAEVAAPLSGDLLPRYSPEYFCVGEGDLNEAADLVAECRV